MGRGRAKNEENGDFLGNPVVLGQNLPFWALRNGVLALSDDDLEDSDGVSLHSGGVLLDSNGVPLNSGGVPLDSGGAPLHSGGGFEGWKIVAENSCCVGVRWGS